MESGGTGSPSGEQLGNRLSKALKSSTCKSLSQENNYALRFLYTHIYHANIYDRENLEIT